MIDATDGSPSGQLCPPDTYGGYSNLSASSLHFVRPSDNWGHRFRVVMFSRLHGSTCFRCLAHSAAIRLLTRVEPVKLTRRTAGYAIIASTTAAASAGALVMKAHHALQEAGFLQRLDDQAVRGGAQLRAFQYSTTVLPQASGTLQAVRCKIAPQDQSVLSLGVTLPS